MIWRAWLVVIGLIGVGILANSVQSQNTIAGQLKAEAESFRDAEVQAPQDEQSPAIERIVFGSCIKQDKPQPIWDAVIDKKPDLFIFAGDNVYADTTDPAEFRKAYAELANDPGFAALRESTTILGTWDDHDFGVNDGWANFEYKAEAQHLMLDFFGVPWDSPRRQLEGVYHAETFGPEGQRVQVILLDTRYHRSALEKADRAYLPNEDPQATMLGDVQWNWLEEQLKQPADVRLIVSSIQFVSSEHRFEKWANFPLEKQKFIDLIRDTEANGVVILSGDRHHGELSFITKTDPSNVPYPIYDLTASGMNSAIDGNVNEPNAYRVGEVVGEDHAGMVTIDWENQSLTLSLFGVEGDVLLTQAVLIDELKAR